MAVKTLKKGDQVSWSASQGKVKGRIVKEQTQPTKVKGHRVAASGASPQYIVKSAKTGAVAAHKASSLKKEKL